MKLWRVEHEYVRYGTVKTVRWWYTSKLQAFLRFYWQGFLLGCLDEVRVCWREIDCK